MESRKTVEILRYAKYLYEHEDMAIIDVFEAASEAQGGGDVGRANAVKMYVMAMPDPERVMKIQDMLVSELLKSFDAAIKLTEEWHRDADR